MWFEPPEVCQGLEAQFGSRAPRIVQEPDGKHGTYVAFGNTLMNVGRLGIVGNRLDNPATCALIERGYDGLNPGIYDPAARLSEQETDGVISEVMYPSVNMAAFAYPERDVVHAVFRRHNDWMREYCSRAPERLVGVACLPLPEVDEAIEELDRVANIGYRGVAISCTVPLTLENMFQDVPEDEKRKMTRDNVIELYGINVPEVTREA